MKTEQGPIPCYYGDKLLYVLDPKTLRPIGEPEPERVPVGQRRLRGRSRRFEAGVTCYFIGAETGPVKIGFAIDAEQRLKALQSGCPIKLSILAMTGGGIFTELEYHERFAAHRLHGEWFERVPEIEAEIDRLNAS